MPLSKKNVKTEKRYGQVEAVLRLALQMQRSYIGVSLQDIQSSFKVSRRTAERMRDAVLRTFGESKESVDPDGRKRWSIPAPTFSLLPAFNTQDFLALKAARGSLRADGRETDAAKLSEVIDKIKGLIKPDKFKHIDVDLEALTEAEGLARRPRPRPKVNEKILSTLREAMLACKKVRIKYLARTRGGAEAERVVCPLGFLYGTRHYLCAYSDRDKEERYYTMSNIKEAELLKQDFQRGAFSLTRYASRSFGVFQEDEQYDVEWKFSPKAAKDASEFIFHPSQKSRRLKDGSLLVSFKACGLLEMCYHLFTWQGEVEIIKPNKLKTLFKEILLKASKA